MMTRLDQDWIQKNLPQRRPDAHKGTYGTVTVLGGCSRYRGAPLLACGGALRGGAGIVRLASIEAVCGASVSRWPGCTLLPLPQTRSGAVAPEALPLLSAVSSSAMIVGCGLSANEDTHTLLQGVLKQEHGPLVLDADALNILAGHWEEGEQGRDEPLLAQVSQKECVLTPHWGEMARLLGCSVDSVGQNPQQAAAGFASRYHCVVVLKSHHTVVAGPEGTCYINDSAGNAGLAKGGSGDVLAGMIGALLGWGLPAQTAAAAAVWLHATAGDLLAQERSQTGMLPQELPDQLCKVWQLLDM